MKMELIKEKEHKNGDVTFIFNFDDEFKEVVKSKYDLKRYSHKAGTRMVLQALHDYLVQEKTKELDVLFERTLEINGINRK